MNVTRLLGCVAFGIPAGLALFAVIACVVVYVGHPDLLKEFP